MINLIRVCKESELILKSARSQEKITFLMMTHLQCNHRISRWHIYLIRLRTRHLQENNKIKSPIVQTIILLKLVKLKELKEFKKIITQNNFHQINNTSLKCRNNKTKNKNRKMLARQINLHNKCQNQSKIKKFKDLCRPQAKLNQHYQYFV